uniref:Zf-CCHC domain-containing protein/DUF4219 domain-containing protein/UBN2 domain-containing protein n=1 Tax=Tanacetum cinerariifolium TaxID=118510 RepID=A0A6L2JYY1_TANCI|nr:zf-CCHC domain-containing protein/DUF4219 domain-containing protein/UBN2 domain-containing protein [Tanacetum cinerariifolium]
MDDPETKIEVETPYALLKDDKMKKLGKNNEAKMTLYNALLTKEVWHTLIITQQGNSQVKDCKIELLTQQYKKFSISSKETIDSDFIRFSSIVTSLKSLHQDHSSKNHVKKLGNRFDNRANSFERGHSNNFENKGGESSRQKRGCYNCGEECHFISEFPKAKENKDFIGRALSDSEDDDEPQNDAICLKAVDSH